MCNHFANAYFHDEDAMTASSRYQNKGMVVRMVLSHTQTTMIVYISTVMRVFCVYIPTACRSWACKDAACACSSLSLMDSCRSVLKKMKARSACNALHSTSS